jgi:hypothetical protein
MRSPRLDEPRWQRVDDFHPRPGITACERAEAAKHQAAGGHGAKSEQVTAEDRLETTTLCGESFGLRARGNKPERRPFSPRLSREQNKPYIGEVIFDTKLPLNIGRAGQPFDVYELIGHPRRNA